MATTTEECWNQCSLFILVLNTLLCFDQNYKSLWVALLSCVISTRKTGHYESQPLSVVSAWKTATFGFQISPVALCIQNVVIRTRITSLDGSQPSSVVSACKTAPSGPELQVSMSTTPLLSFCACKTA